MTAPYTITPHQAAKARTRVLMRPESARAARLCRGMNGRYVYRFLGYVMTPGKAAEFERLFAEGWDATPAGRMIPPPLICPTCGRSTADAYPCPLCTPQLEEPPQ